MNLQCYARLYGDRWHAICTDLDVAADGASLEEARASLATCLELYLESAEELSAEDRHRWLTRKAPWHIRAQMALMGILHRLHGGGAVPWNFVLESDGLTLAHI